MGSESFNRRGRGERLSEDRVCPTCGAIWQTTDVSDVYSASGPETRSEGKFSRRLRERQAQSAQAALLGMGAKLRVMNEEVELLRELVSLSAREITRLNELLSPPLRGEVIDGETKESDP